MLVSGKGWVGARDTCLMPCEKLGYPSDFTAMHNVRVINSSLGSKATLLRREHRDRREGPYIAFCDHVSSCRLVLFEVISFGVGSMRRGIVPRLK